MKFKKKPVVIEAVRFVDPSGPPDGVFKTVETVPLTSTLSTVVSCFALNTLEGRMRVDVGDWIITGLEGEKYACKPHIFEKTYEQLESAAEAKL
jgi:hypothetical protein